MRTLLALLLLLAISSTSHAQPLAPPVIDTAHVGWGWFDLTLHTTGVTPKATRWTITSGNRTDTLLDKNCTRCAGNPDFTCPGEFYADTYDLLLKSITGCQDNAQYVATAQYTDGMSWSPGSNELHFSTPPAPQFPGDTLFVIIWGHSFASYGPDCSVLADIRFGGEFGNLNDNFGHALQTEMRRSLNRPVVVINEAVGGSNQFDWIHSDANPVDPQYHPVGQPYDYFDSLYHPGHRYQDHKKYAMAVFFIGDNDANNNYPAGLFAADMHTILDSLTNRGIKVIYNSIHYTTSPSYSSPAAEISYHDAWNKEMRSYATNPLVWKGFDYYESFRQQPNRFLGLDGVHPDFSQGIFEIAREVAPIAIDAALGIHPQSSVGVLPDNRLSLRMYPNPASAVVHIAASWPGAADAILTIEDALGKTVFTRQCRKSDEPLEWNSMSCASGTYFVRIADGSQVITKRVAIGN